MTSQNGATNLTNAEDQAGQKALDGGFHVIGSDAVAVHVRGNVKESVAKTVQKQTGQREREGLFHEAEVAQEPRGGTDQNDVFQADTQREDRQQGHEEDFRELVDRGQSQRGRVTTLHEHRDAEGEEKTAAGNSDQKQGQHEDHEGRFLEERERFQAQGVAVRSTLRGGVRKGQSVNRQDEAARRADEEELVVLAAAKERLNEQNDRDPADGPEHEDARGIIAVRNVLEHDGVHQSDRRHVAHAHGDHGDQHRDEFLLNAGEAKKQTGHNVQERQNFLGRKITVRDGANDQRRDDGADRNRRSDPADLSAGKLEVLGHEARQGESVACPDGELEEIRNGKPWIRRGYGLLIGHNFFLLVRVEFLVVSSQCFGCAEIWDSILHLHPKFCRRQNADY